ncbi:hypothetical protein V1477_014819 [Vespula maculifrons]|uniref:Uncharacterized protein n=1 Tax=Vespula maculifrons TaxID=7453 RepID=A0ABD2BIL4_VESMC
MLMQKLYTRTSSKGHNLGHVCLLVVATIRGIRNPVSSLPSIGGAIRGREGGYVGKALGLFRSCPFVPLDQRDQSDTLRAVCAECLTMRLREKDKERDLTGPILSHKLEALICVKSILS